MPYVPNDEELDIQLASAKPQEATEGSLIADVHRYDGEIIIQAAVAGAEIKDLDISILNDMVTIKGSRQPERHIPTHDYYYQELYWGAFARSIILPEEVDADGAKASLDKGILTIRLPTMDKAKTKKLKIELK